MAETITLQNDDIPHPRIALSLGGGGARGLAHIHVLEALDELGLKPSYISGTSIGAIFGASFASGLSSAEIREHTVATLGKRTEILKKLFLRTPGSLKDLWNIGSPRRSLMKPEALLDILLPKTVCNNFEELKIPLDVVATDFYNQEMVVLNSGDITKAVAASITLPAIFRPVKYGDSVLIDGGFSNPLPFDLCKGRGDIVLAIDVTGGPQRDEDEELPSGLDVLFNAAQIVQNTVTKEKLKTYRPDIYLRAPVNHIPVLAFHRVKDILEETKSIKDQAKLELERALEKTVKAAP